MALHEAALSSPVIHFSFSASKSLLKLKIELPGQANIFEKLLLLVILGHSCWGTGKGDAPATPSQLPRKAQP